MKPKKQFDFGTDYSLVGTLIGCLAIFTLAITGMIASFNRLMQQHDRMLSAEICNLVSEKMNSSIRYMTDSAQNMASVLSAQGFEDLSQIYAELSVRKGGSYVSLGFIDDSGTLYATGQEKLEFEKWSLMEVAELADPVAISAPYRSGTTGQPVFTMFTDFYYGTEQHGYMFLTYPLYEIQNIAATESLKEETEVWLMNAESSNIIQCAGENVFSIGSWANANLAMKDIAKTDRPAYDAWLAKMLDGESSASLNYNIGETSYTQVFSNITYMPGWYIVVRIPSSALSTTMNQFRNYVLIFIAVLLMVTLLLIVMMYRQNLRERRMLEQLSIHDPLTKVLNRRAFDYAASQQLKSTVHDAMLLFFDVDYFKQVNDRFGHDAGDRILIDFSDALKKHFNEIGFISRYGGDEFVVLVNTASKDKVTLLLDEMTRDVHAIKPTDDEKKNANFMLSFSAGAACFPEDAENFEDLKQRADIALYNVKKRGRNGYCWYHPTLDYMKSEQPAPEAAEADNR